VGCRYLLLQHCSELQDAIVDAVSAALGVVHCAAPRPRERCRGEPVDHSLRNKILIQRKKRK